MFTRLYGELGVWYVAVSIHRGGPFSWVSYYRGIRFGVYICAPSFFELPNRSRKPYHKRLLAALNPEWHYSWTFWETDGSLSLPRQPSVNFVDCRAILRLDVGFYVGAVLRTLLGSICRIHVRLSRNVDRSSCSSGELHPQSLHI